MRPTKNTFLGFLTGFCAVLAVAILWGWGAGRWEGDGGAAALATAAAGATAAPRVHDSLDHNGDGALSLAEVAGNAYVVARFERADRNKDGKLSPREFDRLSKLPEKKPAKKKAAKSPPRSL